MYRFGIVLSVLFLTCLTSIKSSAGLAQEAPMQTTTPYPARSLDFWNSLLKKARDKTKAQTVIVYDTKRRPAPKQEPVMFVPYSYPYPLPYPYPYQYPVPEYSYPSTLQINALNNPSTPQIAPQSGQPIQIAPVQQIGGPSNRGIENNPRPDGQRDAIIRERERFDQERQRLEDIINQLRMENEDLKNGTNRSLFDEPYTTSTRSAAANDENTEEPENSVDMSDESDDSRVHNEDAESNADDEEAAETPAIVVEKGYLVLLRKNDFIRLPANSALTIS